MDFSGANLFYSSTLGSEMFAQGGWPVYGVKCLFSRGGNEGGRGATPTSTSIFDSYDI